MLRLDGARGCERVADEPTTAGERPQLPRVGKSLQRHYQPCRLEHSPATVTFVLTMSLTYSQLRLSRSADPIHAHCPMPMLKASQGPGPRDPPHLQRARHFCYSEASLEYTDPDSDPLASPIQHRSSTDHVRVVCCRSGTEQNIFNLECYYVLES